MNKTELKSLYSAEEQILGKSKRKRKIKSTDIAKLLPSLMDILDNRDEHILATRLQSIIEEHHLHLAQRICDSRQCTLDDMLFPSQD